MVTDSTNQTDDTTAFLRAARSGNLEKVIQYLDTNLDINTANSNGLNAMDLASKDGHVEIVTELLKRGAKVDAATKKGNTALHIASLAGQAEIVKILIEYGASVNIQSQNGFTPLYMAAQENHDEVVKLLLANGANQSLATEDGFTPLAVAMQQGHDRVVSVLLENDSKGKVRLPALHIAAKKDDCKAADLLLQNDHKPDVTSKSGFTPLHIAAHYGNEEIARLLIKRGADVNYLAKHNISPLHVAAKWGKNNMVKILLENSAMIDAKTRDGLTPLHCAARSGHEQVVQTLLEHEAPISARTKNGLAPLHMASQGDHVDAARVLLYHRAPVDEVTIDYLTSLHVAAHCGHVRVAKLLLDRKADPNARALNGFTPLHIACKKNRIKVVELLLKHSASIESTTESGLTPLHVASFMGCMNIVIFLLQHSANPDVPTVRGETPLHLAARANQTDIIRILLRNGAKVDARAREEQTPLHIASRLGNVDIVMLLLQHGAVVDTTTKDMYTALHIAAKEGQEEVAAILVENHASVKATTKNGFTPLHIAAKYGNMNVAKILLQKDSNLDAQGKNNVTPLHLACHYDHSNVANMILEKGASPHLASQNGHTALHIAARKNQMDIASTLLEHGADPNVQSKVGFTPLQLSAQKGHYDMVDLLIEHGADPNHKAKNGLTALHLCAQEDFQRVASILVKNGANVESETETGYRPIHVAAHFGNWLMIRFLLKHNAQIDVRTKQNYTPLHQAAQQGHANIVTALLEGSASHTARTIDGLTALNVAQKLGYISVMEVLKGLYYDSLTPDNRTWEEKYKVIAPESLQETSFMSDSDDEGVSDALTNEQPYRYLTADLMKSLRDDSLPIDVTRDDPIHRQVSNEEKQEFVQSNNYCLAENFDGNDSASLARLHFRSFLVSFLVDARGGAMKGCRHSGIRLIVPPRRATMPIRVTCRLVKPSKVANPPTLMEGEALATRIIEMGPAGASFLGPVLIDVPQFASVQGKDREIIILRSDNGETWKEHDNCSDNDDTLFNTPYDTQMSASHSGRITRILTTDFPQYFAVVSRIKQEVHVIGADGGILISSVANHVQAVFPPGALTKKIKVGLQAHVIPAELTAKLLGNCVAVSPVITIEPRRRKFHKPITLTIPVPQAANKGMINQYAGETPTLRLLCSIAGGTSEAQWEDVTGSTPLTFMNDRVSFTTTVSARFWLMDCRNISEVPKMATELYKESLFVPFITNFVIYTKRMDIMEATLRILCMTDGKEGIRTLERQEEFLEIVKSRDVEALDGKDLYIEFSGNLVPVTKSGVQLKFNFKAFRQNRLSFHVKVRDPLLDPVARMMFMREPKVLKGEPSQQPICILNIVLPESIGQSDSNIADNKASKTAINGRKSDQYKKSYANDYEEEKTDRSKSSPSESKFINDSLQKEHTDAATIHESFAQKAACPLESVDASYPSNVSVQDELSSPSNEKQSYTEKRRFWEDITRNKRENYQRSESEMSRTSQLTVNESDSECCIQNIVSEEETAEILPARSETMEDLNIPDISECSVAEKAHYFEEQIQKELSTSRPVSKIFAQESIKEQIAKFPPGKLDTTDVMSLEKEDKILQESIKVEKEMKTTSKDQDVKLLPSKFETTDVMSLEKEDKILQESIKVEKEMKTTSKDQDVKLLSSKFETTDAMSLEKEDKILQESIKVEKEMKTTSKDQDVKLFPSKFETTDAMSLEKVDKILHESIKVEKEMKTTSKDQDVKLLPSKFETTEVMSLEKEDKILQESIKVEKETKTTSKDQDVKLLPSKFETTDAMSLEKEDKILQESIKVEKEMKTTSKDQDVKLLPSKFETTDAMSLEKEDKILQESIKVEKEMKITSKDQDVKLLPSKFETTDVMSLEKEDQNLQESIKVEKEMKTTSKDQDVKLLPSKLETTDAMSLEKEDKILQESIKVEKEMKITSKDQDVKLLPSKFETTDVMSLEKEDQNLQESIKVEKEMKTTSKDQDVKLLPSKLETTDAMSLEKEDKILQESIKVEKETKTTSKDQDVKLLPSKFETTDAMSLEKEDKILQELIKVEKEMKTTSKDPDVKLLPSKLETTDVMSSEREDKILQESIKVEKESKIVSKESSNKDQDAKLLQSKLDMTAVSSSEKDDKILKESIKVEKESKTVSEESSEDQDPSLSASKLETSDTSSTIDAKTSSSTGSTMEKKLLSGHISEKKIEIPQKIIETHSSEIYIETKSTTEIREEKKIREKMKIPSIIPETKKTILHEETHESKAAQQKEEISSTSLIPCKIKTEIKLESKGEEIKKKDELPATISNLKDGKDATGQLEKIDQLEETKPSTKKDSRIPISATSKIPVISPEKAAEKIVEKSPEKPAEKIVEKSPEKTAEKSVEKSPTFSEKSVTSPKAQDGKPEVPGSKQASRIPISKPDKDEKVPISPSTKSPTFQGQAEQTVTSPKKDFESRIPKWSASPKMPTESSKETYTETKTETKTSAHYERSEKRTKIIGDDTSSIIEESKTDRSSTSSDREQSTTCTTSESSKGPDVTFKHEETGHKIKEKSSESILTVETPHEITREEQSSSKKSDVTDLQEIEVSCKDGKETVDARAKKIAKLEENQKKSGSIEDDTGRFLGDLVERNVLKERQLDASLKIDSADAEPEMNFVDKQFSQETIVNETKISRPTDLKELSGKIGKPEEISGRSVSSLIAETPEERMEKVIEARNIAESIIDLIETEIGKRSAQLAEGIKGADGTPVKDSKEYSQEFPEDSRESEIFHDQMADDMMRKFEKMIEKRSRSQSQVLDEDDSQLPERLRSALLSHEDNMEKASNRGSLSVSEDLTKDEESTPYDREESFPSSSSQPKFMDRDMTMSPSSISDQIDLEVSLESEKSADVEAAKRELEDHPGGGELAQETIDDAPPREDSWNYEIEQDRQEKSVSGEDTKIPDSKQPRASIHESPAVDSLEKICPNTDPYEAMKPEIGGRSKTVAHLIVRRSPSDEIDIQPPIISPRLRLNELEIKPVNWMIGDEKIQVTENLEPSEEFDRELDEYHSSLSKEHSGSRDDLVDEYERESVTRSSDDLSATVDSVRETFVEKDPEVHVPLGFELETAEQNDFESELVEKTLDMSCQELVDTLQREYEAKTPTEDCRETPYTFEPEKLDKGPRTSHDFSVHTEPLPDDFRSEDADLSVPGQVSIEVPEKFSLPDKSKKEPLATAITESDRAAPAKQEPKQSEIKDDRQEVDSRKMTDDAKADVTLKGLKQMSPSKITKSQEDTIDLDIREKSSTSELGKSKKEELPADLSARYAITVLDQAVKKEIAEVKESLEAAKQDLIEELSENSETIFQIKDSPSEFQFKLEPETIPNELPFLYKEPPSSEGSPVAKPRLQGDSFEEKTKSAGEKVQISKSVEPKVEESSGDRSSGEFSEKSSQIKIIETEVLETQREKPIKRETSEDSGPQQSPIAASRSSSDVDNKESDSTSLLAPQPAPRRRPKPTRASKKVTSESDAGSSSGDSSNYQSCDYEVGSGSRPSSSDIEALNTTLVSGTASEYETALMSMEHSSASRPTSQEYQSAVGTLSSRESMKSLNSLSSGHLGSIDSTGEVSETLVASEEDDEGEDEDDEIDDEEKDNNDSSIDEIPDEIAKRSDSSNSETPLEDALGKTLEEDLPCRMKRSSEMIFQQIVDEGAAGDSVDLEQEDLGPEELGPEEETRFDECTTEQLPSDTVAEDEEGFRTDSIFMSQDLTSEAYDRSLSSMESKTAELPEVLVDSGPADQVTLDTHLEADEEADFSEEIQQEQQPPETTAEMMNPEMENGSAVLNPMQASMGASTLLHQASTASSTSGALSFETVIERDDKLDRHSPDSDSFELVDKPDIIDDFVVIEEVGREAEEFDSEGKSISISRSYTTAKYDRELENLITGEKAKEEENRQGSETVVHPVVRNADLFDFESEESPPQPSNAGDDPQSSLSDEDNYEGTKKWMEMQYQGDPRGYEMEYDRGRLEDIKEEEITDFEAGSSRFGSLGSHKGSIGSVGSMRGSYGSATEYDILTGKKSGFSKPMEHDNVSLSSLQEFESLETAIALESSKKLQCGSQESVNNGSLPRRYMTSRSGHGDDISLSSLKDFEGLEKACREAHLIELRAREEEDLLDHESPENRYKVENLPRPKPEPVSATGSFNPSTSGSDDYEKRIMEIDEIIRIAQANVEKFDRQDDTTDDISQIEITADVEKLEGLPAASATILPVEPEVSTRMDTNVMETSTDSLELEENMDKKYNPLCRSSDSLEMKTTIDFPSLSSDSLNNVRDARDVGLDASQRDTFNSARRISSDSLEMPLVEQHPKDSERTSESHAKGSFDEEQTSSTTESKITNNGKPTGS